jgi:hypothetical protein
MCDIGDIHDLCSVWNEARVRARKRHACMECRGPIEPGTSYTKHFSVFDGDVTHGKICAFCWRTWVLFSRAHNGYRTAPPSLIEVLNNCIAEGDEESDRVWSPLLNALYEREAP